MSGFVLGSALVLSGCSAISYDDSTPAERVAYESKAIEVELPADAAIRKAPDGPKLRFRGDPIAPEGEDNQENICADTSTEIQLHNATVKVLLGGPDAKNGPWIGINRNVVRQGCEKYNYAWFSINGNQEAVNFDITKLAAKAMAASSESTQN